MKRKRILAILALTTVFGFTKISNAQQKVGYINSQEIIELMPEYDSASSKYRDIEETYKKNLEKLNLEYEKKWVNIKKQLQLL